uniref:Uncharacterized protein n=1 Tax=Meloidogyne enterolobii TaxID=390850 RepID=A0A6V7W3A1_MELEN|nr:unnamed protein product [Meloidogyne enterolobii]
MAQIPRLSDDVLYIISEKLLFKNRYVHFDLRITNGYTLFMFHSVKNMRALLSHFSKMKRLGISNYGNDDSENNIFISFGRDDKPLKFYYISKNLFSDLLEAGLLHISHIKITNVLGKLSKVDFSATNENIYKYLVNLEEGLSDSSSSISSSLNISKIIINEPAETIKKHLITLLSMNIETMEIICSDIKILCFIATQKLLNLPSISMNCTKKITTKCTIELNSTTNFVNNLMNYIQFLLLCCPNLESIDFVLTYDSKLKTDFSDSGSYESTSDDSVSLLSPEEFVTNLESFFTSIIDYLKNLENGGKDLKIKIEFYSEFAAHTFDLIPKNNELFSLGKHIEKNLLVDTMNDNYLDESSEYHARDIEIVDSIGRQHKCLFKIFSVMPDYIYSDSDDYFYGGSYDSDEYGYYFD